MKFKVDKDSCIGCGACQAICEEVFEITDDGYATAKDVEVKDEDVKENPTSAIIEVKDEDVKED